MHQSRLCLEHVALRHQPAVYQRSVPRPRLRLTDRVLWAWLSRLWPGWREALAFVQPGTVMAWQRQRFRDHWRRLSQRGMPGRPSMAKEVRELIQAMWQANPTWGSPRIVGSVLHFANRHCHVMEAFAHVLGRYAKQERDDDTMIACLLAWASNMGLGRMGENCDISYPALATTSANFLRLETLKGANDRVSNAIATLPV